MRVLLRLSAGLIGWAIAFCLVYGLHGIGCASGWEARMVAGISLQRVALLLAWAVSVVATVGVATWLSRTRVTPLDRVAVATGWIGVAATVVTFLPVVAVPACV